MAGKTIYDRMVHEASYTFVFLFFSFLKEGIPVDCHLESFKEGEKREREQERGKEK